jgi:glycosyltransferase involved in cell wall biosynthesis
MHIDYLAFIRLPTEKAHGLQIMKTCEALAVAGATVELVIPGRATSISADPFAHYDVQKNFAITALGTPDWVRSGFFGFMASILWFAEAAKWRKGFWKADVVYSRDALVLLQYIFLGRKLVYEAHQTPTALSRFVARRAYRLVVISKGLVDAYIAAGVVREKIILAPDAVDAHLFDNGADKAAARRTLGIAPERKVVFYGGSLRKEKGAETLADTVPLVPEAVFIFAGAVNPSRAEFWSSVPARFLGQILHAQLAACLRAADVLVIANSAHDPDAARYGSPMKLFEYMASGTPIVATEVPAITDILTTDAAFFAKPDDPAALAVAIREALGSPEARARAERALAISTQHSWAARAAHILDGLKAL